MYWKNLSQEEFKELLPEEQAEIADAAFSDPEIIDSLVRAHALALGERMVSHVTWDGDIQRFDDDVYMPEYAEWDDAQSVTFSEGPDDNNEPFWHQS